MSPEVGSVERLLLADDGAFPNSLLPVLLYRQALAADAGPSRFEAMFQDNGWPPQWRASVFTNHHYHSTAHECLGVAAGTGTLMLGGPEGTEVRVTSGDVVVIPAGVAHKRIVRQRRFPGCRRLPARCRLEHPARQCRRAPEG